MGFWNAFRRRNKKTDVSLSKDSWRRKLQITIPGRWYLALTIALGVVGLVSGNNIIYLLESLLLGALILSGILSERQLSALELEFRRFPASAESPCRDQIIVRNLRGFPVFCMEIGEWKDKKFVPIAFVPKLDPRTTVVITARRTFEKRGPYQWEGFVIGTSYPFGFARKLKLVEDPGERLIWPRKAEQSPFHRGDDAKQGAQSGKDVSEGEIRQFTPDDDARLIVWLASSKGTGEYVRPRRSQMESPEVCLDLRQEAGAEFEENVIAAAGDFYQQPGADREGRLILVDWTGRKRIEGRVRALNELAQAQATGVSNGTVK